MWMNDINEVLKALLHFKDGLFSIIGILAAFGVTIEFIPKVKINPISAILGWIGKKLMGNVSEQIHDVKSDLESKIAESNANIDIMRSELEIVAVELDDYKCEDLRGIILDFAAEIRIGTIEHTYDQYARVFNAYRNYIRLIEKRGFENEVVEQDMAFIKRTYQRLLDEGHLSPGHR